MCVCCHGDKMDARDVIALLIRARIRNERERVDPSSLLLRRRPMALGDLSVIFCLFLVHSGDTSGVPIYFSSFISNTYGLGEIASA